MRRMSLSALLLGPVAMAQFTHGNFEANLQALKCDTALILRSKTIRDPIGWTPDGKSLVVKVDGVYQRIDLDSLVLKRFKWRNDLDIAGPIAKPVMLPLAEDQRRSCLYAVEENERELVTRRGVKITFEELLEGGVALQITPKGGTPREVWRTSIEDCQGLAPSPDHRWVAFICSLHGVVVMKLP
jgi:hypothetical protein